MFLTPMSDKVLNLNGYLATDVNSKISDSFVKSNIPQSDDWHPTGEDYWYYSDAKQFNAEQADLQRMYDQYVRQNSLKWTAQQLKDLGINPILSYQYYNSSGAGSSATSISPQSGYARMNADTASDKVMFQFIASVIAAGAVMLKAFL